MRNFWRSILLTVVAAVAGCGDDPFAKHPVNPNDVLYEGEGDTGVHLGVKLEQYTEVDIPQGKTRWDFTISLGQVIGDIRNDVGNEPILVQDADQLVLIANGVPVDLAPFFTIEQCLIEKCFKYKGSLLIDDSPSGYAFEVVFSAERTITASAHIEPSDFTVSRTDEEESGSDPVLARWNTSTVQRARLQASSIDIDLAELPPSSAPSEYGVTSTPRWCHTVYNGPGILGANATPGVFDARFGFDCPSQQWTRFRLKYDHSPDVQPNVSGFKHARFNIGERSEVVYIPLD